MTFNQVFSFEKREKAMHRYQTQSIENGRQTVEL